MEYQSPEENGKHVLNLEEKESSVECEICEKLISSKANYFNHIKIHTKDFYCKICCNSYTSQYKLNLHLSQHLGPDSKECNTTEAYVTCEFDGCKHVFPSKLQLFNHKKNSFEH
ncbi:hypothetical protein NQ314_006027 [Rhamnusium bicolor]|uniref:C2H2-type domain-containing protein n=1 Tax=Rhamnusium bicolor TaxID=1586634 RepID=A0AAV8Z8W5_9CUCU|nr:hypothetical protein NQ314_006027 [Rhamnusium bicolor]